MNFAASGQAAAGPVAAARARMNEGQLSASQLELLDVGFVGGGRH